MPYHRGDQVEVYDPDDGVWRKGVVEGVDKILFPGPGRGEYRYMTIRTEGRAFDRPLVMAIPLARADELLRPR
jgi:hypothetical protein